MFPHLPPNPLYRPGVGMMLLNKKNKIFLGQRCDREDAAWQMPQGGIDLGEDTDQAMLRELKEEIGTHHVEILGKSKTWYQYELPHALAQRLWKGKFKGQHQIWYALRFLGKDSDINIYTPHPEFRAWKWADRQEVLESVVSFKRPLYHQVLQDLWP